MLCQYHIVLRIEQTGNVLDNDTQLTALFCTFFTPVCKVALSFLFRYIHEYYRAGFKCLHHSFVYVCVCMLLYLCLSVCSCVCY